MEHPLIERNPDVMLGKPVIKGTRITGELLMRKLADGFTPDDILEMFMICAGKAAKYSPFMNIPRYP
ncbi:MAG: DUF433 domain-containing protein [Saprospirales bacterium]|jgi:uncharacterized protein (DUF433 family)|nr:DUF433 domain-containing protein [Saprospirales bacterium]